MTIKISELTPKGSAMDSADLVEITQDGVLTRSVSGANIKQMVGIQFQSTGIIDLAVDTVLTIDSDGLVTLSDALTVTGTITGNLSGNATTADSADNAGKLNNQVASYYRINIYDSDGSLLN